MAYPSGNVNNSNCDQTGDGPDQFRADVLDLINQFNALIPMRGVANGFASLDGSALVPVSQLPAASESASGVLEISSAAEAQAFSVNNRIITPGRLASVRASDTEARDGSATTRFVTPANIAAMRRRGCLLRTNTTGQSFTSGVWTAIQFNQELFDTDSCHDNATNNPRITTPSWASKAEFRCNMRIATNIVFTFGVALYKNGSSTIWNPGSAPIGLREYDETDSGTTEGRALSLVSPMIDVSSGDYFELRFWHDRGSAWSSSNGWWFEGLFYA